MAERDDGTPRRLPVVVEIRTFGHRCADWSDSEACQYLDSEWSRCRLFSSELDREEREDCAHGYLRVPACLALDEPDRTAAEAQAHGLGSQP